ncbi:MAG: TIGR00282 family metallophosphoesterase [Patescibacteria group bacterium]|nr:TIGR00282 family metallophosphoesterase [Patescibacteria group bacterium]
MLKILFIADIVGKIGRMTINKLLPKLKKEYCPDLVIANAENLTHGKGLTKDTIEEMMKAGIDWFTNGNHAFSNKTEKLYTNNFPVLRPANYPINTPGNGYSIINVKEQQILLINLIGRIFMPMNYDCPFAKLNEILSSLANKNLSAIIVDMHAEATSEKIALRHYIDGKVSALVGTHTHVMTADQMITDQGTSYLTDVGMVGLANGIIGVDKENVIKTFLTQIKYPHVMSETGPAIFNAVLLSINPKTQKTQKIKPIIKFINF